MAENSTDKIAKLFSFIEKDNEGAFTKTKLKEMLEKSVGESMPEGEIDKLFEEMKVDDDGKVSLSSFVSAMLSKDNVPNIPLDLSELENVFKNVDQAKAGQMGIEDWKTVLNRLGIQLSEPEVAQVMKIACGLMQQAGVLDSSLFGGIGASVPGENVEPIVDTAISGVVETKEEADVETNEEGVDATLIDNLTLNEELSISEENNELKQE